jgi:hypothetical protein
VFGVSDPPLLLTQEGPRTAHTPLQNCRVHLCFFFAGDLVSDRPLGQALAGFSAIFWSTRVSLQLFYYDRDLRRENRFLDVLFLVADGYLAAAFALAALLPGLTEG